MKRAQLAVTAVLVLAGIAGYLRYRSAVDGTGESEVVTEVAVRVGEVTRTTLRSYVTAYGTVEPEPPGDNPAAGAIVGPLEPGVVTSVECVEGRRVEKGATLVRLDSRAADAEVGKLTEAVRFAEKTVERQRTLIKVEGTSQRQLLESEQALAAARGELEAARTRQALFRIAAPVSGTVMRINVRPGESVDLSTVLVELADLDRLVVSAGVPGAELGALGVGQAAEVLVGNRTDPVAGTLTYISPELDASRGTAEVRVSLPAGSGLRPGQFVRLRIVGVRHEDCLAVPAESVVKDSEGGDVIALVQADSAMLKPVRVGLRDGDLVEVSAEGLRAGMAVVTDGAYGLPDGTKIRKIEE